MQEEEISEIPIAQHKNGKYKTAHIGSYGRVDAWSQIQFAPKEGLEVEFYLQPYLLESNNIQSLVSTLDVKTRCGFAVVLGQDSSLQLWIGTGTTIQVYKSTFKLRRWRWIKVHFTIVGSRVSMSIQQIHRLAEKSPQPEIMEHTLPAPAVIRSNMPLIFAAGLFEDVGSQSPIPIRFFNGRIDSPSFKTRGITNHILARYDFSQAISTDQILDSSGAARHGLLVNAPTRAIKGYNWDGSEPDFTKAKYGYGAIHFHEDDLDDAAWPTDFSVTIPKGCRSGAYAIEVKTKDGTRDMVTFFVRPNPNSMAKVAMVLSTFTYLAYVNEHMYDATRSSHMEVPGGTSILDDENYKKMVKRLDLGLSLYDVHLDGSGCTFSTSKRPILNVRPGYVHWAFHRPREFSADLLMIGFLEESGIDYDIVTDHDLHIGGYKVVENYDVLITGCHPEYPSLELLNTYTAFAKTGGNIMYLGGNGFYVSQFL